MVRQDVAETWQVIADALMRYDRKESTKRGYNPNALGLYLARLEEVAKRVDLGMTWHAALEWGFCDRVLACTLRAIGCTPNEVRESVKRA